MRWSDRMQRALGTFKRMFLSLYAWYFILLILFFVFTVLAFIPSIIALIRSGIGSEFFGIPGFPGLPGIPDVPGSPEVPSLPGVPTVPPIPYSRSSPNPNPPVPPGSSFTPGNPPMSMEELAPLLSLAPMFLLTFLGLILISWLFSSAFITGLFHLTKKAFITEKARFKDFSLKGFARVLGWYGVLALVSILFIGLGGILVFSLRNIDYAVPLFMGFYILFLIAVGLFFAPWLSTSVFYMLNHRELSFGQALRGSWKMYWQHKLSFWSYIFTIIGLELIIVLIDRYSPELSVIASLIISPFTTILPIVWVLSHEEEGLMTSPSPVTQEGPLYTSEPSKPQKSSEALQLKETESAQPTDPKPIDSTDKMQPSPQTKETAIDPEPPQDYPPLYTPQIEPREDSPPTYCPTCGKPTRPGASYCAQCGTKL